MIYYYVSRNENYDDIFEMAGYIKGRNGDLLTKINPNPIFHGKTDRTNLLRIFQSEVYIYIKDAGDTKVLGCCSVDIRDNSYCVWVTTDDMAAVLRAKLEEMIDKLKANGVM